MTAEFVIMGTFWVLAAIGTIGAAAAFVEMVRAGGKRY